MTLLSKQNFILRLKVHMFPTKLKNKMNLEHSGNTNSHDTLTPCIICPASFASKLEFFEHIESHFAPGRCGNCDKPLILIDGHLYMLHQHNEAVCNKENQSSANRNSYQGQSIFTRHRAKNKEGDLAFNGEVAKKPARKKIVADNVARKGSIRHLHDGDSGDRPNHSGADDCEEMKVETVYSSEADAKQQRICPIEHEKPQSSNEPTAAPSNILTDEDLRKLPSYRISAKSTGEKHLREYQCDICEKYLLSKRTLAAHMKLHRAIPEVLENNVCDVCGKVLKNKNSLKNHKDTHLEARRYICSYCGKGFRIKNNMLEHTNTHTGLKPHHCTQCDKAFGRRTHLIVHMRIHSGHKPYKCSVEGCERKYAHGIDLKRHLYGAHRIYTKKFECQICSRIYSERKLLTKHMRTHCT